MKGNTALRIDGSRKKFPCACGGEFNKVIDSRIRKDGTIRRIRTCFSCQERVTTSEILEG